MPQIELHEPKNSLFHSSLNEIDLAIREVLIKEMRLADPRDKSKKQNSVVKDNNWLWDESRVFQVDELDTEVIFDTYLLRKNVNNEKNVDISYPLLGFVQEDIDTVFWGTGNRYSQWNIELPSDPTTWEVGDEVTVAYPEKYRGTKAEIAKITELNSQIFCQLAVNGEIIKTREGVKIVPVEFNSEGLRATGEKAASNFKAKAITCKYNAAIICDNRDEIQYLRDHFILRCADANIWFTYASPTLNGAENQIYTVFGIPNLERFPAAKDKIKGSGWIYVTAFEINVWAALTDKPIPQEIIEAIRMNVHVERYDKTNRIVITEP